MEDAQLRKITSFVFESGAAFGDAGGGFYLKARTREKDSETFVDVKPYAFTEKDSPEAVAKRIYLDAVSEAEGRGPGAHVFQLQAAAQGERKASRRMTFRYFVEEDDIGALVPEDATEGGFRAQGMRHLEARERMQHAAVSTMISGFQAGMASMLEVQKLLVEELREHRKLEIDRFAIVKSAVERNEERELKIQQVHERSELLRSFADKAIKLAPVILRHKGLLPAKAGGDAGEDDAPSLAEVLPTVVPELAEALRDDPEALAHLEALVPKIVEKLSGGGDAA